MSPSYSPLISLIQALLRCPSVTPNPDQTFHILADFLHPLGFQMETVVFEDVTNFYAHRMRGGTHLCFAGHVDVVPPGDLSAWTVPPFEGTIKDGSLWGRGVADMKGAIGCFLMALKGFLKTNSDPELSISLLITSDEEGDAINGTQKMVPWLKERSIQPDLFLIGEPTGLGQVGEVLKIGRRGSVTGKLTCQGTQGHIAYPHLADNPIPRLLTTLDQLSDHVFDEGTHEFEPTHLEITSVDVRNPTTNIIPRHAEARFGVRLNTLQTPQDVQDSIISICQKNAGDHVLDLTAHGSAFLTHDTPWIARISDAIAQVTGHIPRLDTSGGTTDGRFLSVLGPVLECGLPETTIHQIDERVALEDLDRLKAIYGEILRECAFY